MHKVNVLIVSFFLFAIMQGCSKKTVPSNTPAPAASTAVVSDTLVVVRKSDSLVAVKPVIKRKPKAAIPNVIVVNDKFASKSVDGRYYYDLEGHRYWRSKKDGKYYLFNKSMLTDDAFKKP
ncbi:MAG: hypothetical protein ABIN01_04100 [Ferruginibacter sp.]